MTHYIDKGDAFHAIDAQLLYERTEGNSIINGCGLSRSGSLQTDIASGSLFAGGDAVDVSAQTVTHDGGDTEPRRDVLYVDSSGTFGISKGSPSAPEGPDSAPSWGDDPFAYWLPQPNDFPDIPGTPVGEVAIEAGATDYDEASQLRSYLPQTNTLLASVLAETELQLPRFDDVTSAQQSEASLFAITGNGSDPEGVYIDMDGDGTTARIGEDAALSQLNIDTTSKDMGNVALNNVGSVEVNNGFSFPAGNGEFNLGRHTSYADTGGSFEEIARFTCASDQYFECYYLQIQFKGGGTNSNVTVRYRDVSAGTTLVSTSDRFRATTSSEIVTSSQGATIVKELDNGTGGAVSACVSEGVTFVE